MTFPLLIQKDPSADYRTRRSFQEIATLLNALLLNGSIVQTGPATWVIPSVSGNTAQEILANQIFGK